MAVCADLPVPIPNGWVLAGKLQAGELVYGSDGKPKKVLATQHYVPADCYEVVLDDGLTVAGDKHLAFNLQTKKWRDRFSDWAKLTNKVAPKKRLRRPLVKKTAAQLSKGSLLAYDGRSEYSIGLTEPVVYPTIDLPVPPSVFAIWLVTRSRQGNHWIRDEHLEKTKRALRKHGYFLSVTRRMQGHSKFEIRPSVPNSFLFMDWPIPSNLTPEYTQCSSEQRIDFLEGLRACNKLKQDKSPPRVVVSDKDWHFMRHLQAIVESLGIKSRLSTHGNRKTYYLRFLFEENNDIRTKTKQFHRRFVKKVVKVPPRQCVHIKTEGDFVVGEGFIAVC